MQELQIVQVHHNYLQTLENGSCYRTMHYTGMDTVSTLKESYLMSNSDCLVSANEVYWYTWSKGSVYYYYYAVVSHSEFTKRISQNLYRK
jgi:hypothetical protein